MNLRTKFPSWCRKIWFRIRGVSVNSHCQLASGVSLELGIASARSGHIHLANNVSLEAGVALHAWGGRITVGHHSFIGPHSVVYGHGDVEIGNECLIAMHCRILSSNHTIPTRDVTIRSQPDILLPTKIGNDVWLGAGVTVLGGVSIGDGCVVGAGAVVTRDLPAGSIAMGVPAIVTGIRSLH